MAKDYPAQYGRSDMYYNPNGTLPMPSPTDIPRPDWVQSRMPMVWTTSLEVTAANTTSALPVGTLFTFTWKSPIFDLRPDLRSADATPKSGKPVWSTAPRLYVVMSGFNLASPSFGGTGSGLTVTARDHLATWNPYGLAANVKVGSVPPDPTLTATGPINVSSKFAITQGAASVTGAMAGFSPPGTNLTAGDGAPIRYWMLELNFSAFDEDAFPSTPESQLDAAMY